MRRRLYFRPSPADQLRQNQKAMDFLRAISPNDVERFDCGAKEKKERGPVNVAESEGPVKNAVAHLLAVHPRVAIAFRMNSGAAYNENDAYVEFHHMIRGEGVVSDFIGSLVDGRPFAVETKRPDWKGVSQGTGKTARREQGQQRYHEYVRRKGGVAGFARSSDEAKTIIEGRQG